MSGVTGGRLSVRQRLIGIAAVATVAFAGVGAVASVTADQVGRMAAKEHRSVELQEQYLRSDILVSKLRGQVYEVVVSGDAASERDEGLEEFAELSGELEDLMASTLRGVPEGPLLELGRAVHHDEERFLATASSIVAGLAQLEPAAAEQALRAFDEQTDALNEQLGGLTEEFNTLQDRAIAQTAAARKQAARSVLAASAAGVVFLIGLTLLAAASILHGLKGVTAAAGRLADGDVHARVGGRRGDEIGALGDAFNATADSLASMLGRLEQQGQRDSFGRELNEALEMADTEEQTFEAIGRSMTAVSADHPAELLIADSSRAHLEGRTEHPDAGAPGCPVESPFGCVAVRRGTATTFADSRALNACPMLRDRSETPCSAVCVPVTFMGRALGVLHTTAPVGAPPDAEEIARLSALATAAGARIGTVRSFERTQLQASTDGLTGLMNRRTFETTARQLLRDRGLFAVVMADVDHFKRINDTHGHEAGDRALQLFAEQLRAHLRGEDLLARYGGEEFVLVLPGATAIQAVDVLDRFRGRLAQATAMQPPAFTVSFGVTDTELPDSLAGLLKRADRALYRAKAQGRDRVFVDEVGPAGESRQPTASALERSLLEDDPFAGAAPLR